MSGPCSRSCSGCASSTAREAPCGARTKASDGGALAYCRLFAHAGCLPRRPAESKSTSSKELLKRQTADGRASRFDLLLLLLLLPVLQTAERHQRAHFPHECLTFFRE